MNNSTLDELLEHSGKIIEVDTGSLELKERFIDFADRFADLPGTVLLMSGGELDCARYHILGVFPWLTFSSRHRTTTLDADGRTAKFHGDPLDLLRSLLKQHHFAVDGEQIPLKAGLLGYLAYDFKDCLEKLPRTGIDDLGLPHLLFFAPSILIIHDKKRQTTQRLIILRESNVSLNEQRAALLKKLEDCTVRSRKKRDQGVEATNGFCSNFSRIEYIKTIEKVKQYILDGDIYQVNISQRFQKGFSGDAFDLFCRLYAMNPAPFFAFVNAGSHQIVSTSPERFLLQNGSRVETRPIKGTRPRGRTPKEDLSLRDELTSSPKEEAELSMIVDLLRNDIGKVCEAGSVRVRKHKRVEAYQNVYHLVSIVEGKLDAACDSVDLIAATFPGGSITGCPKVRAMEIIDELEPYRRHIYTGSIGYISFHDTMDLSIAIRTATVINKKILFSVGGGIVYDSKPEEEYDETLHKGRSLMDAFQGCDLNRDRSEQRVWFNGRIRPLREVRLPVLDLGVQYGYGFFETIRVDQGRIGYPDEHIRRFNQTWEALINEEPPDITWEDVIIQVLEANGLLSDCAAVKILATRGTQSEPPFDYNLIVTVRPYIHRFAGKKFGGLRLTNYPEPRQTPLARYKTTNYLYYLLAGNWARDQGVDEALITNTDGTVSETNTANLLLVKDGAIIRPNSPHALPGVMEQAVCRWFRKNGYTVKQQAVSLESLRDADQVLATNSLIGTVPVSQLDDWVLKTDPQWVRSVNPAKSIFYGDVAGNGDSLIEPEI